MPGKVQRGSFVSRDEKSSFAGRRPLRRMLFLFSLCFLLPLFFCFLFFRLTKGDLSLRIELLSLLMAMLLHEGGHLLAIKRSERRTRRMSTGIRSRRFLSMNGSLSTALRRKILLRPWGIELHTGRSYRSYGEQIFVSLAGPAANLLTALLLCLWMTWCRGSFQMGMSLFAGRLFHCSLLYAFLNLLPIEGLDGGSALEALLLFLAPLPMDSIRRLLQILSLLLLIPLWLLSLCVLIASNGNLSFFALCVSLFLELYRKQSG